MQRSGKLEERIVKRFWLSENKTIPISYGLRQRSIFNIRHQLRARPDYLHCPGCTACGARSSRASWTTPIPTEACRSCAPALKETGRIRVESFLQNRSKGCGQPSIGGPRTNRPHVQLHSFPNTDCVSESALPGWGWEPLGLWSCSQGQISECNHSGLCGEWM